MQNLKQAFLAVLLAVCVFYVEGFPEPGLVFGKLGSGTGKVASGVVNGASTVGSGVVSGAVSGASAVGSGVTNKAYAVGSGVASGAYAVGSGVACGANAVANGVVYGAVTATNGVLSSAKFFTGGAQAAANLVTDGVLSGANMVADGVPELGKALSGVTTQYLTSSLGLPNLEDYAKFDMFDMFANIIIGQTAPEGGCAMNFETAVIFLEKLALQIPALNQLVTGLKIVSFVLPQIRDYPEDKTVTEHAMAVMEKALEIYFQGVDPELKEKLMKAAPLIPDAATGDKDAALDIIKVFMDRNTLKQVMFSAAEVMGYGSSLQYVLNAASFVSNYASKLQ